MGEGIKKFKFYDAEERAKRFREAIKEGYISKSDLPMVVELSGIPDYAKEEVIRLALKK